MISINFILNTKPGKNLEFLQTMGSIIVDLYKVKGCMNIDFKQDDLYKDQFCFRLDWQNKKLFKSLLKSKEYDIFEGAIKVLCHAPTVEDISAENRTKRINEYDFNRINLYEQISFDFKDDKAKS